MYDPVGIQKLAISFLTQTIQDYSKNEESAIFFIESPKTQEALAKWCCLAQINIDIFRRKANEIKNQKLNGISPKSIRKLPCYTGAFRRYHNGNRGGRRKL